MLWIDGRAEWVEVTAELVAAPPAAAYCDRQPYDQGAGPARTGSASQSLGA